MPTSLTPLLTGPWMIKRGALEPAYRVTLRQANKQPLDLSGGAATFVMRLRGNTVPTVSGDMAILQEGDAVTGINVGMAEYEWVAGDTDGSGIYDVELLFVDANGRPLRVPNEGYLELVVEGNLSGVGPTVYDGGGTPQAQFDAQFDGGNPMRTGTPIGEGSP